MNRFFKRLSLPVKLLLLTLLPIVFILFLFIRVYQEKTIRKELISGYIERVNISSDISNLIDALQVERRFSFAFALNKSVDAKALMQAARPATDLAIKILQEKNDRNLKNFPDYTFLNKLSAVRNSIDTSASTQWIMQYYTTAIFRLNTLNIIEPLGTNRYLMPVYAEIVSQKILSEMITYLGIIRINIYNALHTKAYMKETLLGTGGVYDIYNSYENEFGIKTSPVFLQKYKQLKEKTELKPTIDYINRLFKNYSFDTLYDAEQWWKISLAATDHLRSLRKEVMVTVKEKLNSIYNNEEKSLVQTQISLMVILGVILGFMLYITRIITKNLDPLDKAAQKIASGDSAPALEKLSNDVIGNLSESISRIGKSNMQLVAAAEAIGKGNFNVPIYARSEKDVLSNAIMRMRDNLRRFTAEVERSKELFKEVADTAPVMIWMTNENKECNFVNKSWLKFTGRKYDQEMGYSWIEGMHPDDFSHCQEVFNTAFNERKEYSLEYRFKRSDGEYRWLNETGVPRYSAEGKFEGYIGTCIDVHEMKVLDQRKEDFIKMASHELKTPVTSIKGYVQLLMKAYDDQEKNKAIPGQAIQTSLATIHKQIEKLSRLMSELLDLTRIETGRLELNMQSFSLNELVKEMVEDVQQTTSHHISIENDKEATVLADRDRIGQVILNLLTNAIKYSRNGNEVQVKLHTPSPGAVAVTVVDHGIGIDKKDQQKIFERFFRVEGKSEQTYPGFGIGLFIASEIIHRHSGTITVESEKGKGSAFTFTLPLAN